MSHAISGQSVTEAWLRGLEHILDHDSRVIHLALSIDEPCVEDAAVTRGLDAFVIERGGWAVSSVANTIFPQAFYRPQHAKSPREHLYTMAGIARVAERKRNRYGNYFDRLIDWPGTKGGVNQLEVMINRLIERRGQGIRNANLHQMELTTSLQPDPDIESLSVPVHCPSTDIGIMGFPCLSHLSFTLEAGTLHLCAVYRNHYFVQRAYGNYLGLGRLLRFVSRESGFAVGELCCISSHAMIDPGAGYGKRAVRELLAHCKDIGVATPGDR